MSTEFRTTEAAWDVLYESGTDLRTVARDIEYLRNGMYTAASLLARCLEGAEPDRIEGWTDYVSSCVEASGV